MTSQVRCGHGNRPKPGHRKCQGKVRDHRIALDDGHTVAGGPRLWRHWLAKQGFQTATRFSSQLSSIVFLRVISVTAAANHQSA